MLVLAARQLRNSTAVATRRWPRVSPPLHAGGAFDVTELDRQDVIYICAHGIEGGDTLYGDNGLPFLTADQIRAAKMPGCIVYLAGCYGRGALSDAFLSAGAAAVVCDRDVNWSGPNWPTGSNRLGQLFLHYLGRYSAGVALDMAKMDYASAYRGVRDAELLRTVHLVGNAAARRIKRSA